MSNGEYAIEDGKAFLTLLTDDAEGATCKERTATALNREEDLCSDRAKLWYSSQQREGKVEVVVEVRLVGGLCGVR